MAWVYLNGNAAASRLRGRDGRGVMTLLLLMAMVLLLAGCSRSGARAPASGASASQSSVAAPAQGLSRLYFYRNAMPLFGDRGMLINDVDVGSLGRGEYFGLDLPAGRYKIGSYFHFWGGDVSGISSMMVDLGSGRTTLIRSDFETGLEPRQPILTVVGGEGFRELSGMKAVTLNANIARIVQLTARPAAPAVPQARRQLPVRSSPYSPAPKAPPTPGTRLVFENFSDPKVQGVVCQISGSRQPGAAPGTDPTDSNIACSQNGPINFIGAFAEGEEVFSGARSRKFSGLHVLRFLDSKQRVLVYMLYSDQKGAGVPGNSVSVVVMRPWR